MKNLRSEKADVYICDEALNVIYEWLLSLDGIGEVTAKSIVEWLQHSDNLWTVFRLLLAGVGWEINRDKIPGMFK